MRCRGGIIVSLVLDQLFTEVSSAAMSKLEIYTFGSAASHFSNPRLSRFESHNQARVIPYIEHYANEFDMVPRWGVLHSTRSILSNRYAGSVFVRMGASGHMFNQHYMGGMFSTLHPNQDHPANEKEGRNDPFLDRVVNVDTLTVSRRQNSTMQQAGLFKTNTGLQFGDGEQVSGNGQAGGDDPTMTFDRTDSGRLLSEEFSGKTVRQLSRFWRYQGGRTPDDDNEVDGYATRHGR